jgi:serine/threonine protein phosphatase PrpC
VQSFVDAGVLQEDMVRGHAERNLLFAALGVGDELPAQALDTPFEVEEGDAFLICTDGFWEAVREYEMSEALLHANAAEEWLVRMEKLIVDQGRTRTTTARWRCGSATPTRSPCAGKRMSRP